MVSAIFPMKNIPNQDKSINVTPEMRAAGAYVIDAFHDAVDSGFLASEVYKAMARKSPPSSIQEEPDSSAPLPNKA